MIIFININKSIKIAIYGHKLIKHNVFLMDNRFDINEYKKFKDYYIKYNYFKNKLNEKTYYNYSEKLHRYNGPSHISYFNNGKISYETYHINNISHREDGPAIIEYDINGEITKKIYCLNDKYYSYEDYLLEIKKLIHIC